MAKYTIYPGSFPCHTCKIEVKTVRVYPETKEITWMCPEKHVSVVNLSTKKSRKDYE
jgi:hypothetical protein